MTKAAESEESTSMESKTNTTNIWIQGEEKENGQNKTQSKPQEQEESKYNEDRYGIVHNK